MSVLRRTGHRMGRRVAWQIAGRLWQCSCSISCRGFLVPRLRRASSIVNALPRWRFGLVSRVAFLTAGSLVVTLATNAQAADYVQVSNLYRTGKYAECIFSAAQAIEQDQISE